MLTKQSKILTWFSSYVQVHKFTGSVRFKFTGLGSFRRLGPIFKYTTEAPIQFGSNSHVRFLQVKFDPKDMLRWIWFKFTRGKTRQMAENKQTIILNDGKIEIEGKIRQTAENKQTFAITGKIE